MKLTVKLEKQTEIEPINEFLDNIINQRWKDTDTPATESKKSLQKQLENIKNKIEEATGTVKLGKQIVLIKKYLSEIKKESLDEISNNIIERINEEVQEF